MRSVSICHAAADDGFASDLAVMVEHNTRAAVDRIIITAEHNLLAAADQAMASDVAILIASPSAMPPRWTRDEFHPVLIEGPVENQTQFAVALLEECSLPRILRQKNFFDARADRLECWRAMKRWILAMDPPPRRISVLPEEPPAGETDLGDLQRLLSDQPGSAEATRDQAIRFAHRFQADFDGLFWVDCRGKTEIAIIGELGAQLGLKMPGQSDVNVERIREALGRYRCLVVFEGQRPAVSLAGRTSILVAGAAPLPEPSLESIAALRNELAGGSGTSGLHHALAFALNQMSAEWWRAASDLARAAIVFYRTQDRVAEAFEIVEWLVDVAVERLDRDVITECAWERSWILESWGKPSRSVRGSQLAPREQLSFGW